MNFDVSNAKYRIRITKKFDKDYKKIVKQGKNVDKLIDVIIKLSQGEQLESKYRIHRLNDDGEYKDCHDLHIEPDWILIYKYEDDKLILTLSRTGSHSSLF